jgi:hypothetical protein
MASLTMNQVLQKLQDWSGFHVAASGLELLTTEEWERGHFFPMDSSTLENSLHDKRYNSVVEAVSADQQIGKKGLLKRYNLLDATRETFMQRYEMADENHLYIGIMLSGLRVNLLRLVNGGDPSKIRQEYWLQAKAGIALSQHFSENPFISEGFLIFAARNARDYIKTIHSKKDLENKYNVISDAIKMTETAASKGFMDYNDSAISALRSKIRSYQPRGSQWLKYL